MIGWWLLTWGNRLSRCAVVLLLLLAALGSPAPIRAQSPANWELLPYNVRIIGLFPAEPEWHEVARGQWRGQLLERIERETGEAWRIKVDVSRARGEPRGWIEGVSDVASAIENDEHLAVEAAQIIWLAWSREANGWRLAARSWDQRTQHAGPPVMRAQVEWHDVIEASWSAVREAFQPLALIDQVEQERVRVRVRAGALFDDPRHVAALQPNEVLVPRVRFDDREGRLLRIAELAWTLLQVETMESTAAQCRLLSGYRSPLAGRRRGRSESLAVRVKARERGSWLELVDRGAGQAPLSGYEVLAADPPGVETRSLGRTDSRGRLWISAGSGDARLLVVRHGEESLARLPLVPGLISTVRAELNDDSVRLEVEGFIQGVQERIVDRVAQRELTLLHFRRHLEQADFAEAKRRLEQLRALHQVAPLRDSIRSYRTRFSTLDALTLKKVQQLLDDTETVLAASLDPRWVKEVEAEFEAARRRAP